MPEIDFINTNLRCPKCGRKQTYHSFSMGGPDGELSQTVDCRKTVREDLYCQNAYCSAKLKATLEFNATAVIVSDKAENTGHK